ncbi:MAG: DUF1016 N-terminal domain-containing protein, partial [Candidatus Sericytochromatia bacterium]
MNKITPEYKEWLTELKGKIRSVQIKASIAVNSALIEFYWDLGKMISEKENVWGSKLIEKVAKDLQEEFPDMKGLSRRNLFNTKKFYQFYENIIVQQPVALIDQQPIGQLQRPDSLNNSIISQLLLQIPWG